MGHSRYATGVRRSFDYGKRSPLHKRQSRNRFLKRTSSLFKILGILALLISGVLTLVYPFRAMIDRPIHLNMTLAYGAGSASCFLLHWLLERIRDFNLRPLDTTRATRKNAYRKAASDDRKRRKRPMQYVRELPDKESGKEGAVLILVLVLVALITGLVLQAQISARGRLRLHEANLRQVQLHNAATEGIRQALEILASDADLKVDHLDEPWTKPFRYTDPDHVSVFVSIEDENRYFDINNLSVPYVPGSTHRNPIDIYLDLLNQCGEFSAVVLGNALLDWIDEDDQGLNETSFYLEQDPSYQPGNRLVYQWNEVLWIDGYTRTMFDRRVQTSMFEAFESDLIDSITILPVPRPAAIPVNLNTAAKGALRGVLGMGYEGLVDTILATRLIRPIRSLAAVAVAEDPEVVAMWQPYVTVQSSYFRIQAAAHIEGHSEQIQVLALRTGEGDMRILQWVF